MSYKERIVNFFSKNINNTTINKTEKVLNFYDIEEEYYNILSDILHDCNLSDLQRKLYFSILYKLIFYARDTVYGINNSEASYIMLGTFIQFGYNNKKVENEMNILAFNALLAFIRLDGFHTAYGDWNDIKYFCNYLRNVIAFNNKNDVTEYQIFKDIIGLYVNQLADEEKYLDIISTVTTSMPREKSKVFGWLAYYISTTYYQSWINTATTVDSYNRAVRKCLTYYRALLANPNKLPLYTYIHKDNQKEDNNKIIDNWTKLLLKISNERYGWADEFIHSILDSDKFKTIPFEDEDDEEEVDEDDEEEVDEDDEEEVDVDKDVDEDVDVDEEEDDEEDDEDEEEDDDEEEVIEVYKTDIAINPLFDESNTNDNKQADDNNQAVDNKKSGWFGWLGWN
jgi:hypothetical protein